MKQLLSFQQTLASLAFCCCCVKRIHPVNVSCTVNQDLLPQNTLLKIYYMKYQMAFNHNVISIFPHRLHGSDGIFNHVCKYPAAFGGICTTARMTYCIKPKKSLKVCGPWGCDYVSLPTFNSCSSCCQLLQCQNLIILVKVSQSWLWPPSKPQWDRRRSITEYWIILALI